VLRYAWDFRSGRLPSAAEVAALQARVGWSRVHWSASARTIALPEPGMELDFGGFGKEYAADRAAGLLLAAGVTSGYVNLAGDLRVIGPRPDGAGWRFAIQHPRDAKGVIASVELAGGGLATSGDYERYLEAEGQRYCHILDARTGWPAHDWQSVSVTAPLCIVAGALATIAMLAGEAAPRMLAGQASGGLLVDAGGTLHRL
jgi:thiamine biosynthesis lipoprotein